jgi:hypothetical protein
MHMECLEQHLHMGNIQMLLSVIFTFFFFYSKVELRLKRVHSAYDELAIHE